MSGLANIVYTVRVTDTSSALTGYAPTYERTELTTAPFNYQESVELSVAADVTGVDFGYAQPLPTYAAVAQLRAYLDDGSVTVEWRTSLEVGTVGFHLLRLDPATGAVRAADGAAVPGLVVHPQGGIYRFRDAGAPTEGRLTYALLEQDVHGRTHPYGPYAVSCPRERPAGLSTRGGPGPAAEGVQSSGGGSDPDAPGSARHRRGRAASGVRGRGRGDRAWSSR